MIFRPGFGALMSLWWALLEHESHTTPDRWFRSKSCIREHLKSLFICFCCHYIFKLLFVKSGSRAEDQNLQEQTNELVLDGGFVGPKNMPNDGFVAPEINSFGKTFRFFFFWLFSFLFLGYLDLNWIIYFALKATSHGVLETPCRDYNAECERQKSVEEFYRLQHINQTYDFVSNVSRIK